VLKTVPLQVHLAHTDLEVTVNGDPTVGRLVAQTRGPTVGPGDTALLDVRLSGLETLRFITVHDYYDSCYGKT